MIFLKQTTLQSTKMQYMDINITQKITITSQTWTVSIINSKLHIIVRAELYIPKLLQMQTNMKIIGNQINEYVIIKMYTTSVTSNFTILTTIYAISIVRQHLCLKCNITNNDYQLPINVFKIVHYIQNAINTI